MFQAVEITANQEQEPIMLGIAMMLRVQSHLLISQIYQWSLSLKRLQQEQRLKDGTIVGSMTGISMM